MATREFSPTRIALLELAAERGTAREGYALLDETRMLLAARILGLLRRHAAAWRRWRDALGAAEAALTVAFERHGVRDLELWPVAPARLTLALSELRLLGVRVPEVALGDRADGASPAAVDPSPEAHQAADGYRALLDLAPGLAALEVSLWRLADEYRRIERRAAAIEHLLLPELERDIAGIEAALEGIEQEEAQRVRRARRG